MGERADWAKAGWGRAGGGRGARRERLLCSLAGAERRRSEVEGPAQHGERRLWDGPGLGQRPDLDLMPVPVPV